MSSTRQTFPIDSASALREALLDKLQSRSWRAGHRLPTERELGDQFGLSRSTVRRVLGQLKDRGLITQTVGSGTYVSHEAEQVLFAPSAQVAPTSPAELMSARLVLEPALIDMVVANATSTDFMRFDECCSRGEAASTFEEFEHWDGQLHEAIANAAHNTFMRSVFQLMNQVRAQAEWGQLKRRSATPERRAEYQREHRALADALKARDADAARQQCLAHLLHVRRNLLGS